MSTVTRLDFANTHPDHWETLRHKIPLGAGPQYQDLLEALRGAHPDGGPQEWTAVIHAAMGLEARCGLNGNVEPGETLPLMRTALFQGKYEALAAALRSLRTVALEMKVRGKSALDNARMRDDNRADRGTADAGTLSDEAIRKLRAKLRG